MSACAESDALFADVHTVSVQLWNDAIDSAVKLKAFLCCGGAPAQTYTVFPCPCVDIRRAVKRLNKESEMFKVQYLDRTGQLYVYKVTPDKKQAKRRGESSSDVCAKLQQNLESLWMDYLVKNITLKLFLSQLSQRVEQVDADGCPRHVWKSCVSRFKGQCDRRSTGCIHVFYRPSKKPSLWSRIWRFLDEGWVF